MTRAPAAAVKNIRTAAETRNSIAAKPGLVLCRLRLSYLQHDNYRKGCEAFAYRGI